MNPDIAQMPKEKMLCSHVWSCEAKKMGIPSGWRHSVRNISSPPVRLLIGHFESLFDTCPFLCPWETTLKLGTSIWELGHQSPDTCAGHNYSAKQHEVPTVWRRLCRLHGEVQQITIAIREAGGPSWVDGINENYLSGAQN